MSLDGLYGSLIRSGVGTGVWILIGPSFIIPQATEGTLINFLIFWMDFFLTSSLLRYFQCYVPAFQTFSIFSFKILMTVDGNNERERRGRDRSTIPRTSQPIQEDTRICIHLFIGTNCTCSTHSFNSCKQLHKFNPCDTFETCSRVCLLQHCILPLV